MTNKNIRLGEIAGDSASPALEALARGLRMALDAVRELASNDPNDWINQRNSPLGKRAHLELVRRGKLRGFKVGRYVLVRRRDLDAYIIEHPVKPPKKVKPEEESSARRASRPSPDGFARHS